MNKIKAFFLAVVSFFSTTGRKCIEIISDISTVFREGGKGSPIDEKRVSGIALIVAGIKLLYVGADKFVQIVDKGWYSVFIFAPSVICFVVAVFFFYFANLADIQNIASSAKDLISATHCGSIDHYHSVSDTSASSDMHSHSLL